MIVKPSSYLKHSLGFHSRSRSRKLMQLNVAMHCRPTYSSLLSSVHARLNHPPSLPTLTSSMSSQNTFTQYDDYTDDIGPTDQHHHQLARIYTNSSVSTNATAPNLPGPGRTIGLLMDKLGAHLERFMNVWASRNGLGPKAVAQEIRRLRRHDETSIVERHAGSIVQLSKRDEKLVKKLCERLLKYARWFHENFTKRFAAHNPVEDTGFGLLNSKPWKKLYASRLKILILVWYLLDMISNTT